MSLLSTAKSSSLRADGNLRNLIANRKLITSQSTRTQFFCHACVNVLALATGNATEVAFHVGPNSQIQCLTDGLLLI